MAWLAAGQPRLLLLYMTVVLCAMFDKPVGVYYDTMTCHQPFGTSVCATWVCVCEGQRLGQACPGWVQVYPMCPWLQFSSYKPMLLVVVVGGCVTDKCKLASACKQTREWGGQAVQCRLPSCSYFKQTVGVLSHCQTWPPGLGVLTETGGSIRGLFCPSLTIVHNMCMGRVVTHRGEEGRRGEWL
jgi:hypothetical protein